jgi:hypothetical protein
MWEIVLPFVLLLALIIGYKKYNYNKIMQDPQVILMIERIEDFNNEIESLKSDYFIKPLEEKIHMEYKEVFGFLTDCLTQR